MAQDFNELEGGASEVEQIASELVWETTADTQGEPEGLAEARTDAPRPQDSDEYRNLQRIKDREVALARRERDEARAAMARLEEQNRAVQDRLDADRLRNATPQQIHAFYQDREKKKQAEVTQVTEASQVQQHIVQRAGQVLGKLGMSRETPGLEFGETVDWPGYARLLETVVDNLKGNATTQEAPMDNGPTRAPAQERQDTVAPTRGRVSTARGRRPTDLWASYFRDLGKLRKGDHRSVIGLRKTYEKRGLDFRDMPRRRGR